MKTKTVFEQVSENETSDTLFSLARVDEHDQIKQLILISQEGLFAGAYGPTSGGFITAEELDKIAADIKSKPLGKNKNLGVVPFKDDNEFKDKRKNLMSNSMTRMCILINKYAAGDSSVVQPTIHKGVLKLQTAFVVNKLQDAGLSINSNVADIGYGLLSILQSLLLQYSSNEVAYIIHCAMNQMKLALVSTCDKTGHNTKSIAIVASTGLTEHYLSIFKNDTTRQADVATYVKRCCDDNADPHTSFDNFSNYAHRFFPQLSEAMKVSDELNTLLLTEVDKAITK